MSRYKDSDYIIWDARNGNVIPAIGAGDDPANCVFTKADAEELAKSLNMYVFKNTMPVFAGMKVEVKGPFYARPASMRGRLEGRVR